MTCTLCQSPFSTLAIRDEENAFCCTGCFTVFQILSSKEIKENFTTHPLFISAVREGLISNPHIEAQIEKNNDHLETLKIHLEIGNMWCSSCANLISLLLRKEKGIQRCIVDYATDLACIEYAPKVLSKEKIFEKIEKLGYQPKPLLAKEKDTSLWTRFAVSLFCTLNLMYFAYPLYFAQFDVVTEGYDDVMGWLSFLLAIPLITYCCTPIWRRFWTSLKTFYFGMETLVVLGCGSSFVFSTILFLQRDSAHLYYDSMGMVISLVLLGKILEKKTKFSAKESLFRLTRTFPKKGYKLFENGTYTSVPVKEIAKGDILLVRTGEKVVLDGIVETGEALVDESLMTGESLPRRKTAGSSVIGGTILKKGSLHYKVTKETNDSLLTRIFQVIEKDLEQKKRFNLLLDQVIKWFVPFVFLLSLFGFWKWGFLQGLSVLLISCPCAIGIAIPLAESLLLQRFAEMGAFVRNRAALSILAKNPFFVFDKTGTLTEGKFSVLSGLEGIPEEKKRILKTLTSFSTHPISSAIFDAIDTPVTEFFHCEEKLGRGLIAKVNQKTYLLGSEKLLLENQIHVPSHNQTVVYFTEEKEVLATIHLGDRLKDHLPKLKGAILSGDSQILVEDIAKKCDFLWGKGGCSPLEKKEEIEKLKKLHRYVVMVGDGVNDAPALTAADVGITVSSGSDASIEISDIFLTTSKLDILEGLISLAKKGRKVIFTNLFWAFFYNVVGIALAVFGLLTPFFAALAMTLSGLFVTLNSFYFLKRR